MNTTIYIDRKGDKYEFRKGKPLRDIPSSWITEGLISIPALASNYNTGVIILYTTPTIHNCTHEGCSCIREYRYSTLRDGCFDYICGTCFKLPN